MFKLNEGPVFVEGQLKLGEVFEKPVDDQLKFLVVRVL